MGPEFGSENGLSNHAPMAVEVLTRRGYDDQVDSWLDRYVARLETLPALPTELWPPSFAATWAACAAITVAYAPAQPLPAHRGAAEPGIEPDELMARAAQHADEHVIKLTDTVLDVYARSGDLGVLSAATRCASLIEPPQ
jgi:hypothetical protein